MTLALVIVVVAGALTATSPSRATAQNVTLDPKITQVIAPLATVPEILERGEHLRVELDPTGVDVSAPADVSATLTPSFGAARSSVELTPITVEPAVDSTLWPDRTATAVTFEVPWQAFDSQRGDFVEDLYDLTVTWPAGSDTQPRAVDVVDDLPRAPRFVVLADPSVGDPRPVQDGVNEIADTGSTEELVYRTRHTVGAGMDQERWAALKRAIDEINLVDPDVVFVTGDLTFGLHTRGVAYEYEEAYGIINRLRAPAYVSPGNHDLYTADLEDDARAMDGWDVWPEVFGPLHYSLDLAPELHLVSINTFDWAQDERLPADPEEQQIRSGGQIRDEQLAWLGERLAAYRSRQPTGSIVTFAHHDPSWMQNRHPWEGINRLELRDLLAQYDVGVHFSGHKHNDRVARYFRGDVVETNGQNDGEIGELHLVRRDGSIDDRFSQRRLGQVLRTPAHGPLFVTTTTAASGLEDEEWGLGGYWGWRYGTLTPRGPSYDPIEFGYPATREFLDENAERPDNWNPEHAAFGLFSYPSFRLSATTEQANDGSEREVVFDVVNDLLTDEAVLLHASLAAAAGEQIAVDGGRLVTRRSSGEATDVTVAVEIAAATTRTVTISATPAETDGGHTTAARGEPVGTTVRTAAAPTPVTGGGAAFLGLTALTVAAAMWRRSHPLPR